MRTKILSFLIVFSFIFCGIGPNSLAQDKKENKNTKIEGKTDHPGQTKVKANTKDKKVMSDSVSIKTKGKNAGAIKVTDKEVGKTDDGKTLYQGPKGGKYYLNDKGKKVYVKEKSSKSTSKKESKDNTGTK